MTAGRRYTAARAFAFARRLVDRASWHSGGAVQQGRIAGRRTLAAWGVPVRRELLVLGCARGNEASGVFSEVCAVLGCLDHFETERELYTGVVVDFKEDGLYYEPSAGPNWWEYYFEPITVGVSAAARPRPVPLWLHDLFAEHVERALPRDTAAALTGRYVRVNAAIAEEAERFWREQIGASTTIAVHYRGTDKYEEAPRVAIDAVAVAVRRLQASLSADWKLFLATDEQACVDYMRDTFPGRVVARHIRRSVDGRPIHKAHGSAESGRDAVIDCVLLSKAHHLVRTPSNLGLVATFMNGALPVTVVSC